MGETANYTDLPIGSIVKRGELYEVIVGKTSTEITVHRTFDLAEARDISEQQQGAG